MNKDITMLSFLTLFFIWVIQGIIFKIVWNNETDRTSKKFWTYYMAVNVIVASLAVTIAVLLFKENTYQVGIGIFTASVLGHISFIVLVTGAVNYFEFKDTVPVKAVTPNTFKDCSCWACQTDDEHDAWLDKFRTKKEC